MTEEPGSQAMEGEFQGPGARTYSDKKDRYVTEQSSQVWREAQWKKQARKLILVVTENPWTRPNLDINPNLYRPR